MKKQDLVFIYHSSCKDVGIAGLAIVSKECHPDLSALDPKSPYFDPKATKEEPRWYLVTVKWKKTFKRLIPLKELKTYPELKDMVLLNRSRLSVQPVSKAEFDFILKL